MTSGTLKERVYSAILSGIINGEYPPDSLISEKQLCEKLSVSKSPVREALVELCLQNVLRSVPRQGYVVVRCTEQDILDMIEYRALLECSCLERSFDRITPTQIARLESIVESEFLFLSQRDTRDYWNYTLNFHLTLASFAENTYIFSRLNDALNACMRAYLQLYWTQWQANQFPAPSKLHGEILNCIRNGAKQSAIELLKRDISTFSVYP